MTSRLVEQYRGFRIQTRVIGDGFRVLGPEGLLAFTHCVEDARQQIDDHVDDPMVTEATRTETNWGVRMSDGSVEWMGLKPDGSVGVFTEDEARYLARGPGRELVKRTRRVVTQTSDWDPVT